MNNMRERGPLTSTWPHLRCDVGLEAGKYWKYCVTVDGRLYRALILLGLALSFEHLCVFSLHGAIYIYRLNIFLLTSFSLPLVS